MQCCAKFKYRDYLFVSFRWFLYNCGEFDVVCFVLLFYCNLVYLFIQFVLLLLFWLLIFYLSFWLCYLTAFSFLFVFIYLFNYLFIYSFVLLVVCVFVCHRAGEIYRFSNYSWHLFEQTDCDSLNPRISCRSAKLL